MHKGKEASAKVGGGARHGQGVLCQSMEVALYRAKEASAKVKGGEIGQGGLCQGNKVGLFSKANKLFLIQDSSVTSGKIPGN